MLVEDVLELLKKNPPHTLETRPLGKISQSTDGDTSDPNMALTNLPHNGIQITFEIEGSHDPESDDIVLYDELFLREELSYTQKPILLVSGEDGGGVPRETPWAWIITVPTKLAGPVQIGLGFCVSTRGRKGNPCFSVSLSFSEGSLAKALQGEEPSATNNSNNSSSSGNGGGGGTAYVPSSDPNANSDANQLTSPQTVTMLTLLTSSDLLGEALEKLKGFLTIEGHGGLE